MWNCTVRLLDSENHLWTLMVFGSPKVGMHHKLTCPGQTGWIKYWILPSRFWLTYKIARCKRQLAAISNSDSFLQSQKRENRICNDWWSPKTPFLQTDGARGFVFSCPGEIRMNNIVMKNFAKSILNYFAVFNETRFRFSRKLPYEWSDDSFTLDLSEWGRGTSPKTHGQTKKTQGLSMKSNQESTTADKASTHDTTMPLLESMYSEFIKGSSIKGLVKRKNTSPLKKLYFFSWLQTAYQHGLV